MIKIEVNGKEYNVEVADTEESMSKGLQGVTDLPENQGMLFVYDEPQSVGFWMKDTLIPLDIIFIDEDWEVISKYEGTPNTDNMIEEDNVMFVLELNAGSRVVRGNEIDLDALYEEDEEDILDLKKEESEHEEVQDLPMLVVGPKGKVQMELKGGERIFSRKNTKTLIRIAKRAYKSKLEKDYKALGKKVFQYLEIQNNKDEDFVELPK